MYILIFIFLDSKNKQEKMILRRLIESTHWGQSALKLFMNTILIF